MLGVILQVSVPRISHEVSRKLALVEAVLIQSDGDPTYQYPRNQLREAF